jgi:hypothetical protein
VTTTSGSSDPSALACEYFRAGTGANPVRSLRVLGQTLGLAEASSTVTVIVSSAREVSVTLKPAAAQQTVNVSGAGVFHRHAAHGHHQRGARRRGHRPGSGTIPLAMPQLRQYRIPGAGNRAGGAVRPYQSAHHRGFFRRQFRPQRRASVDGADNSDDYIGGFLQNFSPDAIQEFAVQTSQQDADTGRTVGGSVEITTKSGTNLWHGGAAFYERAAALDARYPIENPPPLPKQPFSRQNYIGTLGGPIVKDKLWFFASVEAVHEDASIAYSPASLTQFQALASLAAQGLIPGISSIPVPEQRSDPVPRLLGSCASTGRNRPARSGSCAPPSTTTPPTTPSWSRPRFPPPAPPGIPTTGTWCWASSSFSARPGWEPSRWRAADCA